MQPENSKPHVQCYKSKSPADSRRQVCQQLGGGEVDTQLEHLLNNGRIKVGNLGSIYVLSSRNPYDTSKVRNNIHFIPSDALKALVGRQGVENYDGKELSTRK